MPRVNASLYVPHIKSLRYTYISRAFLHPPPLFQTFYLLLPPTQTPFTTFYYHLHITKAIF